MPVAGKPEARAEGIRFVAREATRIPSPYGSGLPAAGHGGRRPPVQFGHGGRRTALEFGHGGGRPPVQRGGTVVRGRRCRRWRMPVAGKPEARAEGIRCVAREATRIPSPHGSGVPATGHGGRRPPCSVRARWWETAGAACGHGREGTAVPMVADARCREARGASRGNTVRCKRSDTYSLTSRFGLPGNRARRSETAVAVRTRRSEDGARVRARWWENGARVRTRRWEDGAAACGHGRGRTAVPTVADARCREARGASRGNTVRCKRSDTYSLTSRFGPPGSRA
jgi:hypothetical protein